MARMALESKRWHIDMPLYNTSTFLSRVVFAALVLAGQPYSISVTVYRLFINAIFA